MDKTDLLNMDESQINRLERRRELFVKMINSALKYRTLKRGDRDGCYNEYINAMDGLIDLGVSQECLEEFVSSNGYEIRRSQK